jgi:hypothetical protein
LPRNTSESPGSDNNPPELLPSMLASIPDVLRSRLRDAIASSEENRTSTLISSNTIANRFIYERWGIRASQKWKYRNLFSQVRKHCRNVFKNYLRRGWMEINTDSEKHTFGVYEFDDKRGNLVLGFVRVTPDSEWYLRRAGG